MIEGTRDIWREGWGGGNALVEGWGIEGCGGIEGHGGG